MSNPAETLPEATGFNLDVRVVKAFGRFAGGFWTGSTAKRAWALTLGLAASLIVSTYATVQMNHWNRWFFDALEKRDVATVKQAVLVFLLIVAAMAAIGVAIVITRETLQVRWRQWLVEHLLATWLARNRFYHLNVSGREPPNPEYRISDDSRWATEVLVDLGIGLLSALVGGIAFISILWSVGGAFTIGGISIPGYMVWAALAYGIAASLLMAWVGRPLVGRVGTKNEAEGYFRFGMMRVRDNAEAIALMGGTPMEFRTLERNYAVVVERWLKIVRSHGHVTWITNTSGPMIPIIPLLFAAPKYLAGDLSLGQVTQLAAAFVQVQIAISWVVDNYNRIAEWYASARRVMDIVDACEKIDAQMPAVDANITRCGRDVAAGAAELRLDGIEIDDARGNRMIAVDGLSVRAGEFVHVSGNSGTGKTTIARLIEGFGAPSRGRILMPAGARCLVAWQKTYIPLGTLENAVMYPERGQHDIEPEAALAAAGLGHFVPRLHDDIRWDHQLSVGEQQRLSIARLLLQRFEIAILDDPLSALEHEAQLELYRTLRTALPGSIILSFGQRPLPPGIVTRQFVLERGANGSVLKPLPAKMAQPA